MKNKRLPFQKLNKAFLILFVLLFGSMPLCGYSGTAGSVVVLDGSDLGTLKDIEASYTGQNVITDHLNKEDFVVNAFYKFNNSDDLQKFGPVDSNELVLSQDYLLAGKNTVTVTYKGISKDVVITCSQKGYITIIASGLEVDASESDVKQKKDEDVLNRGQNITYAFIKNTTNGASDVIEKKIMDTKTASSKKIEVASIYDISLNRKEETGQEAIERVNAPVRLIIPIEKKFQKDNRTFFILKNHNGVVQKLEDLDQDPKTITIETESFSEYALMYEDGLEKQSEDIKLTAEYKGSTSVGTKLSKDMFKAKIDVTTKWKDGSETSLSKEINVDSINKAEIAEGRNDVEITSHYQEREYKTTVIINGVKESSSKKEPDKEENHSNTNGNQTQTLGVSDSNIQKENTNTPEQTRSTVNTGDSLEIYVWIALFILALCTCFFAVKQIRKQK